MDKLRSLKGLWEKFAQGIPDDAGPVQWRETRIAFYAGATALYSLVNTQLEPGTEATEADLAFMAGIHGEIETFLRELETKTVN